MIQTYQEAANRISELANEFEDCDEVCQHLKAASSRIIDLAVAKGTIIKIASVDTAEETAQLAEAVGE